MNARGGRPTVTLGRGLASLSFPFSLPFQRARPSPKISSKVSGLHRAFSFLGQQTKKKMKRETKQGCGRSVGSSDNVFSGSSQEEMGF